MDLIFETGELELFETLTFCYKACGTNIFRVFSDDLFCAPPFNVTTD